MSGDAERDRPLVSVIMACYNRESTVERAIRSVLAQSFRDFEIVFVDDASTDASVETARQLLRSCDQVLVRELNGGHNAAINSALRVVRGDVLAFCDSDDEYLPGFLEATVGALLSGPENGFAYCRVVRGPEWTIEGCGQLGPALEQGHLSAFGTLVVRAGAFRELAPLPEREVPSDMCNDDRVSFELARSHCCALVPEELYRIIGAPDSVTKNHEAQIVGWDRLFTDYRQDVRRLCGPGTLARHRVTNVERAVAAAQHRTALRLSLRYLAEALTGPRRARESAVLVTGIARSFIRLVTAWVLHRLGRS